MYGEEGTPCDPSTRLMAVVLHLSLLDHLQHAHVSHVRVHAFRKAGSSSGAGAVLGSGTQPWMRQSPQGHNPGTVPAHPGAFPHRPCGQAPTDGLLEQAAPLGGLECTP